MKYKIFLILLTVLLFFSQEPKTINASNRADDIEVNKQIHILEEQIINLQLQVLNLELQKNISTQSYLVTDISNNSVISEKNVNQIESIASITKLMNAVVTLENINIDKKITLTEEMLKPFGHSPSLFLNLNVAAENLLNAMLIQSTNDAAQSLSYFIGNRKFLELMNQKAKELAMHDTYFYDAHGLDLQNCSTGPDLTKLLIYIYKNHPEILTITKNNDFWLPDPTGRPLKFQNLNDFHKMTEFIGGKTGYLPEVKQSLASLFNINGKTVSIILFHSSNRQTDTLKIIDYIKNFHI